MKKHLFFVLFQVLAIQGIMASDLTPAQLKLRDEMQDFLKEEGFMPEIDSDGDIRFKKEGSIHWISIADSGPFYIEFHRAGLKCNDVNRDIVIAAVNEGNKKVRCAKAILNESSISFAVEMYCYSAEAFRYIFYQCLKELESLKATVLDYYNDNDGISESTSSTYSSAINRFFPVYGCMLGEVTSNDFRSKGYNVETVSSGGHNCAVKGLTFWDHDEDNVFEQIYMTHSDYMPDKWESLGLYWRLSYNQILELFKNMGFSIEITNAPVMKMYSGRKTLSADVTVTSQDGHLSFDFDFDYGNSKGEGYSQNSSNSLYSITIKVR